MNQLYVGFSKKLDLPDGGFLFIDDELPDVPRARVFDPYKHSFNPLKDIDYKGAREMAALFYALSPQGENTLTVRNGRRAMMHALQVPSKPKAKPKGRWTKQQPDQAGRPKTRTLDQVEGDEEVSGMLQDVLASPVLRQILCKPTNFSFNPNSVILARVNRAELGEFDALVLGLFLMLHFKGQLVVPDFGFYGRDMHANLIRQERLIAGVNFLDELPVRLRTAALLIEEKEGSGTTWQDAETLALYEGLIPKTNAYNDFIQNAMRRGD